MVDEKLIGRKYGPVEHEVQPDEVQAFLDATDDENPRYEDGVDPAPPMFAVVYARAIIAEVFFDDDLALDLPRLVHGSQAFTFHQPVHPGETVVTEGRLSAWRQKGDNELVTVETTSRVGDQTRTTGTWTFVVRGGS